LEDGGSNPDKVSRRETGIFGQQRHNELGRTGDTINPLEWATLLMAHQVHHLFIKLLPFASIQRSG
jgi:hypothetical protein